MVKSQEKTHNINKSKPSETGGIANDFFSGKIRDRTTKQSRKAADDLALLKSKHKNPEWQPVNAKVPLSAGSGA
jgi:hypothetical protein